MIYDIETIRAKTVPIAKKYGVRRMSLFGSYARGEADDQSDVDLIIDKGKIIGLQYIGFIDDLEDELGCHVDVVSTGISDKKFLAEIKKDEVLLYEEKSA
ncbi:MAG: nucleotidyltransferase domain-containing protein [Selenomonadaceae bacterium]|nr:nucleotidyltransferase domain-containing protein [Selenomonadaceae bacterium]